MAEPTALVQALMNPAVYPHKTAAVKLVQTQMSLVFLTGHYVYKVKKPVNLDYLDYTTLEKRRFFCQQELKLNRRLCPETYLEVVPITEENGRISLEPEGSVIEYAVKMRQLPLERMMNVLLVQNQVSSQMIRRVAERLARFHDEAETTPHISSYGSPAMIRVNTDENFSETGKYVGRTISSDHFNAIKACTDSFLENNGPLLKTRMSAGRIRDCHGDLHTAHVCFTDKVCIYDCIEFNDRFRYCDVASEIAFLAMDIDYHRHAGLSDEFVSTYVEYSKDRQLLDLLAFYKCYRAYVRGKVESFKLDDPLISPEEKPAITAAAARYFELAHNYAVTPSEQPPISPEETVN